MERLVVESEGWARAIVDINATIRLRFSRDESGRFYIAECSVTSSESMTDLMRAIPFGRLEALANTQAASAALAGSGVIGGGGSITAGGVASFEVKKPTRRDLKLKLPTTSKKPDSFYQRVAEVFSQAAAATKKPAVLIAEVNEVPVTTVHRWVKEARRRGLVAPGSSKRKD